MLKNIAAQDPEVLNLLRLELSRQRNGLVMIPSENFASLATMEAVGTILTNKYSEGYPNKRYYSGNKMIDQIEQLAIDRAKKLFQAEHANVQPHSGAGANQACYNAVLNPGDKILGMNLDHGGHLTHGSPVNFSGKTYHFLEYGVNQETEVLDMDEIRKIALKEKPKLVLSGATAYPRKIDFKAFQELAYEIDAYCMADISHIVGLCLSGLHQNPVPTHDIVMTTTHKTLRGTRGAIILCKQEDRLKHLFDKDGKKNLAEKIDFNVFPGLQGGPLEHVIAGKAVSFAEAMKPEFKTYQEQIVKNAKALAESLMNNGIKLVSNGTDNHLILIDCRNLKEKAKVLSQLLEDIGIYVNRNMIPFDPGTPFNPTGIRLGTPALTSRGMKQPEMRVIGEWISGILKDPQNAQRQEKVKQSILDLTKQFPLYPGLEY